MTWMVIDTESTTFQKGNPFSKSNRLMCVGVLDPTGLHYYDIEHSGLPYYKSIETLISKIKSSNLLIFFNGKYDLHWLRRYLRIKHFPSVFDCQLAEFLIRNQTNPYPSLDFASQLRGFEPKHDLIRTDYWERGLDTDVVPRSILEDRVLSDVKLTYELYLQQLKELEEQGKTALHKLQCEDLLTLQEMEYNGMVFDVDTSKRLAEETSTKVQELTSQFKQITNLDCINLDSPKHLSALLYGGFIPIEKVEHYTKTLKSGEVKEKSRKITEYLTLPRLVQPLKRSESASTTLLSDEDLKWDNERRREAKKPPIQRTWSTDEPTLRSLKATGKSKQIIGLLLQQAKLEKLRGTYYTGIPELIDKMAWKQGVIHGQFNQCVARTGRLSSSKPNLQNFSGELKPLFASQLGTLVNVDAKGLEWVCALYLSQDPVGIKELLEGVDHHEVNQQLFHLLTRLIAKTYLFRLIYGGSAFAYANDPDFANVSGSEKFWQQVIDDTYAKYKGLGQWHTELMKEAGSTGVLVMPTGRQYIFKKEQGKKLPDTQIKNYPVQGLGAELLSIIRVSLYKRMKRLKLKSLLICTVHDSILLDCYKEEVDTIVKLMYDVFRDLPKNFERVFGVEFNLPLLGEITSGPNWGNMKGI